MANKWRKRARKWRKRNKRVWDFWQRTSEQLAAALNQVEELREKLSKLEELDLVFHELIADPEANIVLRAFGLGYLMEKEDK